MARQNRVRELSCKALTLRYQQPDHFLTDQWGFPPYIYLIYRWLAAIYFFVWLILSVVFFSASKSKYLLNLTNWVFVLLTFTAVYRAIVTTIKHRDQVKYDPNGKFPTSIKVLWVCENISSVLAFGVTIGFWGIVNRDGSQPVSAVTIHTHGINALYVVMDLMISARPVRLFHFFHSSVFSLVYVIFSAIYWSLGGTGPSGKPYIYPAMDWRRPVRTLLFVVLLAGVVVIVVHVALWLLYRLRLFLRRQCLVRPSCRPERDESSVSLQVTA